MKLFAITLSVALPIYAYSTTPKMLYGSDDRYEMDSFYALNYKELGKAVAMMTPNSSLIQGQSSYIFSGITLSEAGAPSTIQYKGQIKLGVCTGFLVADDIIATAGHCIQTQEDCDQATWVFDYTKESTKDKRIAYKNTAKCTEIIETTFDPISYADYAIIKLDKKFPTRNILKIRTSGSIKKNTPLVMIGHPNGIPMKLTKNAVVWNTENEWIFQANLDAFSGNSGSPVFNALTKEVEGILVAGSSDFVEDQSGVLRLNICLEDDDSEECSWGEDITRITKLDLQRFQ